MTLHGDTSRALVCSKGIFTMRVEKFQDDRFRLMFVCNDGKSDVKTIPVKFRKGTKVVDLDKEVWPLIEDGFRSVFA